MNYRRSFIALFATCAASCVSFAQDTNWPSFRGPAAQGVATGFATAETWDATNAADPAISWRTEIPGLGHSSPILFGNKLFLTTAVASDGEAPLKVGRGGAPTAADDNGEQSWLVLCYDKRTGEELWRRTAWQGIPRATRHAKATHANATLAADSKHIVAFFGSEGLHCYDHDGNLLWKRDLGVVNISKYGIGWGYASSPSVFGNRVVVVCDAPDDPYVAAFSLTDGEQVWRSSRTGDCERSWGTPLIHPRETGMQIVVNGWPWIVSYDLEDGTEVWRVAGGGDNPVPTPFAHGDYLYLTNAHGGQSPIYAIRPTAKGNLTESAEASQEAILWQTKRGGCYLSTPVVLNDYLYLGNTNGAIRCFHALTGEKIYQQRLGNGASVVGSLVAADGKIYCPSEDGFVYVLKAGSEFEILAKNPMGEPCFASPALSAGVLYIRTTKTLFAIQPSN